MRSTSIRRAACSIRCRRGSGSSTPVIDSDRGESNMKRSATWTIARHEVRAFWRDGRMRWTTAITFVLVIAALLSGWSYQQRLASERSLAQSAEQSRWLEQGEKNPHSAAHYGTYV